MSAADRVVEAHYADEGPRNAPVLVLSGSLGSTLEMWDPILADLRKYRVIRVDHRGHGGSPVIPGPYTMAEIGGDIVRLLDRLEVERASICGLSLGGMAAMWVAANAARRVERLMLLSTSARLGPAQSWHDRAALVRRDGMGPVAEFVVARWFTPGFRLREPAYTSSMARMIASTPREGYAGCCEAIAAWDFEQRLGEIRAPTLVVVGAGDEATPPPHAHAIGARISGARVVVVDEAAHVPIAEQPARISELLLRHLDDRDSGEA